MNNKENNKTDMGQSNSQLPDKDYVENSEDQETAGDASASPIPTAEKRELSEEESVESLKQKAQQYLDQILRLQAEFSNYRKRTEKEKAEAIRFGREVMIEKMISLADVLEEALKHSRNAKDVSALKKGFEMVVLEFIRFLKSEGAEPLKTVGESFDPHLHEAVEQVKTEKDDENDLILEEVQKGYTLNGRLMRPAKVKVAKKSVKEQGSKSESLKTEKVGE